MRLGFVKETPRLALGPQMKAMAEAQCDRIYEDVEELLKALRPGDEVAVCRTSLLARRGGRTTRQMLDTICGEIFGKGASIIELETGRTGCAGSADWTSAIIDAVDELAGKNPFKVAGELSVGRNPKRTLTEAERLKARAEWFRDYADNEARVAAIIKEIGEPFDYPFGYRLFGKPSAKPD